MSLTLANKITLCRILTVPFFVTVILTYAPDKEYLRFVALALFLFAVVSDVADGYIARKWHQKTQAGAILDPLADKLLLMCAYCFIYKIRRVLPFFSFPVWLVVAVISRDIVLVLGSMIIRVVKGSIEIVPTIWGKATSFFQVIAVMGVLTQWKPSIVIWPIVIALTLVSSVDYIYKGIKIINT